MQRIYNLNVFPDWWKIPSPSRNAWASISQLIKKRAPHCRGVVLLGLDAPIDELKQGLNNSAGFDICKGFAIGRTIFGAPSKLWLENKIDDAEFVKQVSKNYLALIEIWQARQS